MTIPTSYWLDVLDAGVEKYCKISVFGMLFSVFGRLVTLSSTCTTLALGAVTGILVQYYDM